MDSNSQTENNQSALKKRPLPSFIKKLWFILNDTSSQEYIYWVDNGQVICVPNASTFSNVILPRFFKHSNWQSFVRQLNLYGFRKVYQLNLAYDELNEKKTTWQFKHECFRKDNIEKLCEIKRRATKPQEKLDEPSPSLNQQQEGEEGEEGEDIKLEPDFIEQTLSHFSQRLERVDKKRKDLMEQTVELSRIQQKQQKAMETLMDFIIQLLNKYPSSESERLHLSKLKQNIMDIQPFDLSTLEQHNLSSLSPSPSSPPPPSLAPPPPLPESQSPTTFTSTTSTTLPSISSLMTDHSNHVLPPLRKRRSYK